MTDVCLDRGRFKDESIQDNGAGTADLTCGGGEAVALSRLEPLSKQRSYLYAITAIYRRP